MRKKISAINKNFFIFIICCILSIFLFFSKDINEVKNFKIHISNFFSIIFSPKNSANDFLNLKSKNDSLINELKNMKNLNFELEQKINNIDLYSNYDKKLDKLISNYRFIPARILSHSFSKSANILNLNIGLKDGVPKQYKAVVDYKGNLIGRTSFVTDNNTEVHKINDKHFHVYVKTKDDIFGQFSYVSGKVGVIESVAKKFDKTIQSGDIFYTTSSSNIYPANIKVAQVISVKKNHKKHELDIRVEILANLNALENVFIIK